MATKLGMQHLRMLAAIEEHDSVSRAAEALGITQSALSHQIAEAERRCGARLFERVNKKLRFTVAGERLLGAARLIVAELERAEADVAKLSRAAKTVIRIGSFAYSCYRWLPSFLAEFQDRLPTIDVEIVANPQATPARSLLSGEIDLGVTAGRFAVREVSVHPLFDDELVAILPPHHPLAREPYLEGRHFVDETFVTYSAIPERGFEEDLVFAPSGMRPTKVIRAGLTEAVVELVRANFGVGILSNWAVAPYVQAGLLLSRRLGPQGASVSWSALTRANSPDDAPALHLARALQLWCREGIGSPLRPLPLALGAWDVERSLPDR
jgi:LysR family transcriptional regulator for metE and metH